MNTRVELRVQGLTNSQIQSGAYALILAEENTSRRIPVIVGTAEAQSIAIALESITPPRPLTHDLFVSFAKVMGVVLKEVFIYKFEDGVFYSELLFTDGTREIRLDSRTSDAIAIALRMKSRIYTTEAIMHECGVDLNDSRDYSTEDEDDDDIFSGFTDGLDSYVADIDPEELEGEEELIKWLSLLDRETLQERLDDAIAKENYEYARRYKDELHKREREENNK
ncbi:MAG: bifunctional nuclease family protein [Tannerellaceae bacterium]|nr:bifunctional nuclease family protein [Tannerellaceae bacterium]